MTCPACQSNLRGDPEKNTLNIFAEVFTTGYLATDEEVLLQRALVTQPRGRGQTGGGVGLLGERGVQQREEAALPEAVAGVHQLVGAALELVLEKVPSEGS